MEQIYCFRYSWSDIEYEAVYECKRYKHTALYNPLKLLVIARVPEYVRIWLRSMQPWLVPDSA